LSFVTYLVCLELQHFDGQTLPVINNVITVIVNDEQVFNNVVTVINDVITVIINDLTVFNDNGCVNENVSQVIADYMTDIFNYMPYFSNTYMFLQIT
jgi:hypothetical protein